MKRLLLAICAFTFYYGAAQQKMATYFSVRGGAAFIEDNPKGIGHISFGASPNQAIGIGVGIGFAHVDKPYIPLTVDISFFGKHGRISPVLIGSAGYGIYNDKNEYFKTKGGFTGSLNAGIALPAKKSKFFITGGYAIYGFTGGQNIQTSGNSYKAKEDIKAFTITIGVML